MLKSGLFVTPSETYTIYEVTTDKFYRIDFLRGTAAFNVDVDSVAYSQIRRRNTFVFGDSSIFDEYQRITETIASTQMKEEKSSEWVDGAYVSKVHRHNDKLGYTSDCTMTNGVITETIVIGNGYTAHLFVVDATYDVKLDPLNFSDYVTLELSKDTVSSDNSGVFYKLDVLKRRYDLRHIEDYDYMVVTNVEDARRRLKEYDEDPYPWRGVDTETTGTEVYMYGEDHLVGIILGSNPKTATYFPFRHDDESMNLPMSFLEEMMPIIIKHQDCSIAHNKKFDRQVFKKEGYDIRIKWDTMQISIILNPVLGKGIHGEKYLVEQLIHKHFLELDEIFVNPKDINFAVLPPDIVKYYACPDGTNPLLLFEDMMKKLPKFQYALAELECALSDVKADQEYYGIRVDVKKYEKQYRNCVYIIDTLLKAFRTLTHEDGNINSSQVLSNLLYNKMHCKVLMRTKTGQPSTSMAAIKKLSGVRAKVANFITEDLVDLDGKVIVKAKDLANSAYPALVLLAKYKEYNKLLTAFYSRFERTMKTGRIFFWVNQNGAATGRQSSPMHQLPPALKDVILSDANDRDFWGPDYSQVELRMIAYQAQETELIDLATDPDNDIHRIIGSLISNKPMWAITPEERSVGKRRNFGVVYLISKYGLAGQLKGPGYTEEDVEFAEQQLNAFYHRFKRIDRYIKRNAALVQKKGYMETRWFHRRRLFPEVFDPNLEPSRLSSILRMGNNVPVQGTAADLMKLAEVKYDDYIRRKGWDKLIDGFPMVRVMLSIHDECIISAHQSIPYEEIIEMIKECMEIPVEGAPPFFVQPARMDNWGGHTDDACAVPIPYRNLVIENYNKTHESVFHQSYFNLVIPDDVAYAINTSTDSTGNLVTKYYDKCTLQFDHGNYVYEFTEEHVKDALKKYVDSGFTAYRIDDYIQNLNQFRQRQLADYMNGLIKQYGMDYKAVGEHVRHPSLTFALLENYAKQISKDLSHEESITEAARLYIEDLKAGNLGTYEFQADIKTTSAKPTDKDLFSEQLEPLVDFDKDGNVVYTDSNDEDDDIYNGFYDVGSDDIIDLCNNKPQYVWELADCITVDCQDLKTDDINRVISYCFEHKVDNGFYSVNLIYNGSIVDTQFRVEELNIEELNNLVVSMLKEAA